MSLFYDVCLESCSSILLLYLPVSFSSTRERPVVRHRPLYHRPRLSYPSPPTFKFSSWVFLPSISRPSSAAWPFGKILKRKERKTDKRTMSHLLKFEAGETGQRSERAESTVCDKWVYLLSTSVETYVLTKKLMGPLGESMPPTRVKPRLFLPGPFS